MSSKRCGKTKNQVLNSTRLDTTNAACDTTTLPDDTSGDPTGDATLPANWWAWPVVDVGTGPADVIYLNPRDDPARSPSLAPGQVLPTVRPGGERAVDGKKKVGHVGRQQQLTKKKRARFDGQIRSLLRDQVRDPDLHPHPYVTNATNPIYPVPAPTCYSNFSRPDRRQLPGGIILRYRVVDVPYFPVVTTSSPTAEITKALFGDGKSFTYAPLFATTDETNQKGNLPRSIR